MPLISPAINKIPAHATSSSQVIPAVSKPQPNSQVKMPKWLGSTPERKRSIASGPQSAKKSARGLPDFIKKRKVGRMVKCSIRSTIDLARLLNLKCFLRTVQLLLRESNIGSQKVCERRRDMNYTMILMARKSTSRPLLTATQSKVKMRVTKTESR